jgi:hypothetical protein
VKPEFSSQPSLAQGDEPNRFIRGPVLTPGTEFGRLARARIRMDRRHGRRRPSRPNPGPSSRRRFPARFQAWASPGAQILPALGRQIRRRLIPQVSRFQSVEIYWQGLSTGFIEMLGIATTDRVLLQRRRCPGSFCGFFGPLFGRFDRSGCSAESNPEAFVAFATLPPHRFATAIRQTGGYVRMKSYRGRIRRHDFYSFERFGKRLKYETTVLAF